MKIQFDENGKMFYRSSYSKNVHEEKENYIFRDTLKIHEYNSDRVFLKSETDGLIYYMFYTDFMKMIDLTVVVDKTIAGSWTFTAKGCYYGIKLVSI